MRWHRPEGLVWSPAFSCAPGMRGRVRQAYALRQWHNIIWSRGVTVSTLDSESSDRCSNPRGTSSQQAEGVWLLLLAA